MSPSRRKFLGTVTAAGVIGLAGCPDGGGGDGTATDTPTDTATDTPTDTPMQTEEGEPTIGLTTIEDYGSVLVDAEGRTVYMFTADTQGAGESACPDIDGCDEAWPPVTVESEDDLRAAGGLGTELGVIERSSGEYDGELQVTANGWPLYYFVNDEEPGDANGIGVNDAWYLVSWEGDALIPTNPTVQATSTDELGDILVGPEGMTLYMFDQDTQGGGQSACPGIEGCDEAWPPLTVENRNQLEAGENVSAELSTIQREDGTLQVTANGWPLYYFVNDEAAGDVNGQAVNEVWWVVHPSGEPIRGAATVQISSHEEHGDILVGPDGMSLYMFDQDTQGGGQSACPGIEGCDEAWPPLSVESADELTSGPDVTAELTTFEREDGTLQVAANGWPLYYFVNDEAAGDVNGQGVNDVWWLLTPAGEKIGPGLSFESVEDGVTQTNEIIDRLNNGDQSISTINSGTEEYDDVDPMDTIEPAEASNAEEASAESVRLLSEADRVSTEAITTVVAVLNSAAPGLVPEDTDTPEEAREEAANVESLSQEAADFLRVGATVSERASEELAPAAEALGNL